MKKGPQTSNPAGSPHWTETDRQGRSEYGRFESLTRRILSVSKSEVDKQRRKD